MISMKFSLDMISLGICGGASPEKQAEIRAPSIRGQLRWWFRTLGGFKSLAPAAVCDQESQIFGSVAGEEGTASRLQVRVRAGKGSSILSTSAKKADDLGAGMNTEKGYVLFPLRQQARAVFEGPLPSFELHLNWRGPSTLADDIKALATVFGHLGSLGFRSRRAMGALAFAPGQKPPMELKDALAKFANPNAIVIRQLRADVADANAVIRELAGWLKGWRAYGRAPHLSTGPGCKYAENDHNLGFNQNAKGQAYRPALGLPIIQKYSSTRQTSNWEQGSGRGDDAKGRFASPVILRPHRDTGGKWHALVIFVESHKWPAGKKVYLNGREQDVSLDLYEAMKNDNALSPNPLTQ